MVTNRTRYLALCSYEPLHLTPVQVPNVKLRPAEQGLTPCPSFDDCWAQETQLGSDDTMLMDPCPRPFKGLVICATGIIDKVDTPQNHIHRLPLTLLQADIIQTSRRIGCNAYSSVYRSCNSPHFQRSWRAEVQRAIHQVD